MFGLYRFSSCLTILVMIFLTFAACNPFPTPTTEQIKQYIFLGHTYDWQGNGRNLDPRIERIDFSKFDGIWLGGDLCSFTSSHKSTLKYLDSFFDLDSPNTMWAIGNHDFRSGNLHFITETTKRPLHYTQTLGGLCFIVMNSFTEHPFFLDSCSYKQSQSAMMLNVLDTIRSASHLIILMHNVLWADVDPSIRKSASKAANADGSWMDMLCEGHSTFREIYWPKLIEVQDRGVQVILISGDGGQYDKGFSAVLPNGIRLYISGINNSFDRNDPKLVQRFISDPDSILIFRHELNKDSLTAVFVPLNEFLTNQ